MPRDGRSMIGMLIARDGINCHWCKRPCKRGAHNTNNLAPTVDHLIRKADGGGNLPSNLVVACKKCNNERHADGWTPDWSISGNVKVVEGVRMEKHFGKWFKVIGEFPRA
jgi:hypothetical protein